MARKTKRSQPRVTVRSQPGVMARSQPKNSLKRERKEEKGPARVEKTLDLTVKAPMTKSQNGMVRSQKVPAKAEKMVRSQNGMVRSQKWMVKSQKVESQKVARSQKVERSQLLSLLLNSGNTPRE